MPDQAERSSRSFPIGTIVLVLLATLLYVALIGSLADTRTSDAAGRGLAAAFAVIFGAALWIVLGILLMVASSKGKMPGWASIAALVLLPLSAVAAFMAIELYTRNGGWPIIVLALLPPLFVMYALWARISALNVLLPAKPTSIFVGSAILILTSVPLIAGYLYFADEPSRRAKVDEAYKNFLAKQEQAMQETRARDTAKFAALNENSSLREYVEFFYGTDARARQALDGARRVKSRHDDAIALLQDGKLIPMREMWQLDITPSAALCDAYRDALRREAAKIDRSRGDYLSIAMDLEFQLPNLKWLVTSRCDLSAALTDTAARVRAVADSPRPEKLAAALEELGRQ